MSSAGKGWDMSSDNSFAAAARYVMKQSNASVVLVIRAEGCTLATADGITPQQAREAIEFALPGAVEDLAYRRRQEQDAATRKKAAAIADKVMDVDKRRPW